MMLAVVLVVVTSVCCWLLRRSRCWRFAFVLCALLLRRRLGVERNYTVQVNGMYLRKNLREFLGGLY